MGVDYDYPHSVRCATMKKRNWTTLIYLDSCHENWLEELQQTGLEVAISPLHDKDVNPTGELKKPHYHVIISFPGPTTFKCVQELSDNILSGVLVKPIESIRGMYRYFTHKDNPEKFQYNESDIILLNGFDPSNILSNSDESAIKLLLIYYILDNNILEYSDLINNLASSDNSDMLHVAMNHTIFFTAYLNSRRYKLEKSLKSDVKLN